MEKLNLVVVSLTLAHSGQHVRSWDYFTAVFNNEYVQYEELSASFRDRRWNMDRLVYTRE